VTCETVPRNERMLQTWPQTRVSTPPQSLPKPKKSASAKRVSFGGKEEFVWDPNSPTGPLCSSKSTEDGKPTFSLLTSHRKMDALWDLRRTSKGPENTQPKGETVDASHTDNALEVPDEALVEANTSTKASEELLQKLTEETDETLMYGILKDLHDKKEPLRVLEASLEAGLKVVSDSGGARHATAVISSRILSVARRKASLLHDVEARTELFIEAHNRREELVPLIVADKEKAPSELGGVLQFIAAYTHKGQPADENKSQFAKFAASFKLPGEHDALKNLKAIADDAGEFWAKACLSEAEKGQGHAVLRRLFDVALGTGVDTDHPMLVRASRILNDRLAERVLKDAEDRRRKDIMQEEMGKVPKVGYASDLGDKIEQDIFAAVAEGVPDSDHRLQAALEICRTLRQKDGERKRLEGRQKRLDAAAAAKKE